MTFGQETGTASVPATKVCSVCGEEKPASAFWRNRPRRDGLAVYCRACGHPAKRAGAKALLSAAPILEQLRLATSGGGTPAARQELGVRRFAMHMAAMFDGDAEVYRVQLDRLLRGDLQRITFGPWRWGTTPPNSGGRTGELATHNPSPSRSLSSSHGAISDGGEI